MIGRSRWQRYSYLWVTLAFFILSIVGQWLFGWFAYVDEQQAHDQPIDGGEYFVQMSRDTLENWQSEFLQLIWQVAGLAALLYVSSPQSKEGDERLEAKVDALLRRVDPNAAEQIIQELDRTYAREPESEPPPRRPARATKRKTQPRPKSGT